MWLATGIFSFDSTLIDEEVARILKEQGTRARTELHRVEVEPSGPTIVVDRMETVQSIGAEASTNLAGTNNAIAGCHISTLFPEPQYRVPVDISASTTDGVIQHMFAAALDLNVLLPTLDGQPAQRIAGALDELDLGIRLLRESFYRRAGLIDS